MKNIHIPHFEDILFKEGIDAALNSLDTLTAVVNSDISRFELKTKFDGSPSIVCGVHPENKKFFVGTKSVFNKRIPKINYTPEDVQSNHEGQVATILLNALQNFPLLGIKGVVQGDIMFTNEMLQVTAINNEQHITFQPNTLVYASPLDHRLLLEASIGVVFHTWYEGNTMIDMNTTDTVGGMFHHPLVWVGETGIQIQPFTPVDFYLSNISLIHELLQSLDRDKFAELWKHKKVIELINMNLNARIRDGFHIQEPREHFEFLMFLAMCRVKKEVSDLIFSYRDLIEECFWIQGHMNGLKHRIMLNFESTSNLRTFINNDNGLQPTRHEGFVVTDLKTGSMMKFVDRLVFSRNNFRKFSD